MEVPYDNLDPGVRELVRELVSHGFTTTDSGDGKSKPPEGIVLPFLHVFMEVEPSKLAAEADRLQALVPQLVWAAGFARAVIEEVVVEASYRPGQPAILVLMHETEADRQAALE